MRNSRSWGRREMPTEYRTITEIAGPLIFVEKTAWVGYGELVEVGLPDGSRKRGQVLDSSKDIVVVQVFEGTAGIDRQSTVKFLGETIKLNVSRDMLGRILSGAGEPIDGGPPIVPEKRVEIIGAAINPYSREHPAEFIQTGISTIDGLNTLVRGQKLPLFSGAGLPHNEVALQIARQAKVLGSQEPFGVVFAAMGITHEEARVFMDDFERTGALRRAVLFLNLADDPAVERLITPRMALTAPTDGRRDRQGPDKGGSQASRGPALRRVRGREGRPRARRHRREGGPLGPGPQDARVRGSLRARVHPPRVRGGPDDRADTRDRMEAARHPR